MKKHSSYRIGLGRAFLDRAGLIFTIFILITLFSGGSAIYAEYKTGQLKEKVVKPVQKFVSEVAKSFEDTEPPKNLTDPNILISTSSATIKIETKTDVNVETNSGSTSKRTDTTTTYSTPTPIKYEYNTKSYGDSLKELDEWSKQKQAENDAWFNQKVEENKKRSEEQNKQNEQAAQNWFNQKVEEAKKWQEEWKKEHGF